MWTSSPIGRGSALAVAAVALAAPAVAALPAAAAEVNVNVQVQSQITAHNLPYLDSPYVAGSTFKAGQTVSVECQAQGREAIGGTPVWYRVNHVYYPAYAFAGATDKVPCGVAQVVPLAANGYTSPSFESPAKSGVFVTNDNIKILCTAAGQAVDGSNAWFFARGYWLHSSRISQNPNGNGYSTCWGYTHPGDKAAAVLAAARNMLGKYPYSWGGGNQNGPTKGICCSPGGHDDSNVVGFDCSGLTQYAFYQGARLNIGGDSRTQYNTGYKVPLSQRKAGDLVFYSDDGSASGIYHVGIYTGNGRIIEATRAGSGPDVRERTFSSGESDVLGSVVRPVQ
ncbi:NlpC/P60 family protein [Amycolatopsis sp. OK19-0408]|uniref:NlpC/P60 family protein n=1 Tax=Amycolatopsis iheyensis TaxID=2945988 RepID=A0A9X2SHR3_9PSEU|nr:NlpC/P60 family protein [Amycolatopsis iheyensis]MCR6483007.1 NlpC/P60 family protein [Amycolatopsis iheyensis]